MLIKILYLVIASLFCTITKAELIPITTQKAITTTHSTTRSASTTHTASTTLSSNIWYVKKTANDGGDGTSWNTAFNDLQDALTSASSGDQIWITEGTYYPSETANDYTATFSIDIQLSIYGGFVGTESSTSERSLPLPETQLSGSLGGGKSVYHVVTLTGNNVVLDGLTISDGYATGLDDGTSDCETCFGGGILIVNPDTGSGSGGVASHTTYYYTLSQVSVINNRAIQGAGLFAYSYIDLTISDCVFTNNTAFDGKYHLGSGGAIFITYSSDISITSTVFTNNVADTSGGAICIDYGVAATVEESIFTENQCLNGHGGAIFMTDRSSNGDSTALYAYDNTYEHNSAAGYGGAVFAYYDAIADMTGNTYEYNSATLGGAIGFYEVTCGKCCDPTQNTFSNNLASSNHSTDDCDVRSFPYIGTSYTTSDYMPYLETLWNNYDASDEPTELPNQIYVDNSATSSGTGLSWNSPVRTIQEGINLAYQYGALSYEVWVKSTGTPYIPSNVPTWYNTTASYYDSEKSKMIQVLENVNLYGGFAGTETSRSERNWYKYPTVISGYVQDETQAYQILYFYENCYVDGFIIRDGHSYEGGDMGSIIHNFGSTKTNNVGASSNPNSVLTDATPNRGTGIFANATSSLANILFLDNYAWKGAGLYVLNHDVTATNIALVGNFAEYRGGAIGVDMFGNLYCYDCTAIHNGCARKGGGLYVDYGCNAEFYTSEWYNNTALDGGGGLAIDGAGDCTVVDTYISYNSAFLEGPGVYLGSYNPYSPRPNVFSASNIVVSNNSILTGFGNGDYYFWNFDYIDESGVSKENIGINGNKVHKKFE